MRLLVLAPLFTFLVVACAAMPEKREPDARAEPDQIAAITEDLPTVPLTRPELPSQASSFTDREVNAFADQAMRMMVRSFSADVARAEPDEAVEQVLDGLYPTSAYRLRLALAEAFPGASWEWNIANLSPKSPLQSRILRAEWDVSSALGRLDDGSQARVLTVTLQAHASVQSRPDVNAGSSYLIRRTITIAGARPLGGPDWWPSVTVLATMWGADGCDLLDSATIEPLTDPARIDSDVTEARIALQTEGVVQPEVPTKSALSDYLNECDAD